VLGPIDAAGAHGVALDVSTHRQEVSVSFDRKGFERSLIQVPLSDRLSVEVPAPRMGTWRVERASRLDSRSSGCGYSFCLSRLALSITRNRVGERNCCPADSSQYQIHGRSWPSKRLPWSRQAYRTSRRDVEQVRVPA
jgi:hypothetical protein